MRLDAPAFSLSVDMDQALLVLKKRVQKKHWKDFQTGTIKLSYVPYFVFNYTVFSETPEKEGKQVVSEQTGKRAMNANTASFLEIMTYILEEIATTQEKEPSHSYNVELDPPDITKQEASEVAKTKIAAEFQVPRNSVIISGITQYYLPTWRVWVTVGKKEKDQETYRLDIEGVLGTIINEEKVPSRERGMLEVSVSTLAGLQNPENWADYAKTSQEFLDSVPGFNPTPFIPNPGQVGWRAWLTPLLVLLALLLLANYILRFFNIKFLF